MAESQGFTPDQCWWSVHMPPNADFAMLDKIEDALSMIHEATKSDITFHDIPWEKWSHQ